MSTAAAKGLDIARVRASFPALEREVGGKPVAYLDSGASAQRVLASIQAVDRYERRHHSNVHRGSHTLSAEATAAYEGARATVADHIGAADRREVIFVRNATEAINLVARAWGDANLGDGIGSCSPRWSTTRTSSPGSSSPRGRCGDRLGAAHRRRPARPRRLRLADRARAEAGRVAHLSNVLGTENPLPEISRLAHAAGALVLADGAQSAPNLALDMHALGVDFFAFPATRLARPRRRALGAARPAGDAALPGWRHDDPQGHQGEDAWADPPARSRPARRRSPRRSGSRRRCAGSTTRDGRGRRPRARDRRLRARAPDRGPGDRVFGPARRPTGSALPSSSTASTPTTSPDPRPHGVAVRAGHHCAQPLMDRLGVVATARASFCVYRHPRRSTAWSPPSSTPGASSSSSP